VRAPHLNGVAIEGLAASAVGRAVAMIDPLSKRNVWLRSMRVDGRRSKAPYSDYADFMRAIGVREIAAYLAGQASLAQTIAAGQQATRRYAKRQYTWFAHQPPPEWPRFRDVPSKAALELLGANA